AHARILELRSARVEIPALRVDRSSARQLLLLDPAVAHRREVIARRPVERGEFLLEIDLDGFECFEGDLPVAIIFEAVLVEIIHADSHAELLAAVIGHALDLDEAALLEATDLVGTGAERGIERRSLEIARLPICLGEDRQGGDDEMQVAAALFGKAHR